MSLLGLIEWLCTVDAIVILSRSRPSLMSAFHQAKGGVGMRKHIISPNPSKIQAPQEILTFFRHANLKTLLQAAILTAVASDLVNLAVLVPVAGIDHVFLDASAEEALRVKEKERLEAQLAKWKNSTQQFQVGFSPSLLSHCPCT